MGGMLEGSGKPLVIASGTPALPGHVATERDESAPGSPVAGRMANARAALGMAARGVRSSVVGLPRTVHGDGDRHGFIARLVGIARDTGVSGYVGDGSNRWPAVHVLDAAYLFRLAVERVPAGSRPHRGHGQGPLLRLSHGGEGRAWLTRCAGHGFTPGGGGAWAARAKFSA
jgi:nucleoside-diphosphate-sugar epimerase